MDSNNTFPDETTNGKDYTDSKREYNTESNSQTNKHNINCKKSVKNSKNLQNLKSNETKDLIKNNDAKLDEKLDTLNDMKEKTTEKIKLAFNIAMPLEAENMITMMSCTEIRISSDITENYLPNSLVDGETTEKSDLQKKNVYFSAEPSTSGFNKSISTYIPNACLKLPKCVKYADEQIHKTQLVDQKLNIVCDKLDPLYSQSDDSISSDKSLVGSSIKSLPFGKRFDEKCNVSDFKNQKCKNTMDTNIHDEKCNDNISDFRSVPIALSSSLDSQQLFSFSASIDFQSDIKLLQNTEKRGNTSSKIETQAERTATSSENSSISSLNSKYFCQEDSNIFPHSVASAVMKDANQSALCNSGNFIYCKESNEFNDESWGDCGETSDEEICTCYTSFLDASSCSTDNLTCNDVSTSEFIKPLDISDDVFWTPGNSNTMAYRKRKLNDTYTKDTDKFNMNSPDERKRVALDKTVPTSTYSSKGSFICNVERRAPSWSLIPTNTNPPPELESWLHQFQQWSHVERLFAVDKLIEHCEPTQVRHMMNVIEPQFQRDFISLLPKELALQVLSYLEPKDLLRAAQTCRNWRFLCDDNLLWKEKCRNAHILAEPNSDRPKRGRAGNMPAISSPWKAAFIRQHMIEINWRSKPIREPKILKGHDDHVITCLQFHGNRIVSGSDDNTLKVWSAISGKCLRTLTGHTGGVWSSQMSGNIIISGSTDRTLKVWNMESGKCIHTLQGHTSTVRCMHLHGKKVVSGSRDATLRVWDIEKGACLHVLVGHLAAVRCVQYDGKLIVSGAYDYMVKVWNPERQECLHTLQGHTNRVYSLQFDGVHIVSGSLDTSIRVWDAETGGCRHTLMGHQSLTSGMELRQNILVSGNADSTVKVWDIATGQCLQTLSGPNKHQSAVTCLQFNSRFVITSSDDGTVKLWDVKTGDFIRNLVSLDSGGSGGVVWRIRASDTKLVCAVGSRNGTEETKLMVLDFDVDGACAKCS